MATMKKVRPYHSWRDHRRAGVHHDRSDCPVGGRIHSQSLAAGTGSLPRCPECAALDERAPVSALRPV